MTGFCGSKDPLDDEHICERCDRPYELKDGCDPTPHCDPCAHEVVAELRASNAQLAARVLRWAAYGQTTGSALYPRQMAEAAERLLRGDRELEKELGIE